MPSIQIQKIQIKCPKLSLFASNGFSQYSFQKVSWIPISVSKKGSKKVNVTYDIYVSMRRGHCLQSDTEMTKTKTQPIPLFLKSCVWGDIYISSESHPHPIPMWVGIHENLFPPKLLSFSLELQVWTSRNILAIAHKTKNSQCKDCAGGCSRWPISSFPNCSTSLELQVWTWRNTPPITHLHFFTQPPTLEYW